jgi:signal transduction histidine kinase
VGPTRPSTATKNILVSLNRVDAMIHNLLDANRVLAGEAVSLEFASCDLAALMREVVDKMTMVHWDRIVLASSEPLPRAWGARA